MEEDPFDEDVEAHKNDVGNLLGALRSGDTEEDGGTISPRTL